MSQAYWFKGGPLDGSIMQANSKERITEITVRGEHRYVSPGETGPQKCVEPIFYILRYIPKEEVKE